MHIPIPPPHRTQRGTKARAKSFLNRLAKGKPSRAISNERRVNVALAETYPGSDAECLLPLPKIHPPARNLSRAVQAGKFFIQGTAQHHDTERSGEQFLLMCGVGKPCGSQYSLYHTSRKVCGVGTHRANVSFLNGTAPEKRG